jgi:hypothetical protein
VSVGVEGVCGGVVWPIQTAGFWDHIRDAPERIRTSDLRFRRATVIAT